MVRTPVLKTGWPYQPGVRLLRPPLHLDQQPNLEGDRMNVYLVGGGEYSNYDWLGIYATLEAAMASYPVPKAGEQDGSTHYLVRPGGWKCEDDGEWWNGFCNDFGKRINEVEVQE
jgi:hypothetical protein